MNMINQRFRKFTAIDIQNLNGTLKIIVSFLCLIIILLETKTYLLNHPVSTSVSVKPLTFAEQPVITFCFWPLSEKPPGNPVYDKNGLYIVIVRCIDGQNKYY